MDTKTSTPKMVKKSKMLSFGTGPASDWKLIFLSGAAFLLILAGLDTLLFLRLNSAEPAPEVEDGSHTLDLNALKKTTLYYQGKKALFDKIVSGNATGTVPLDPSL